MKINKRRFKHCKCCDYILLPVDKIYNDMCNDCGNKGSDKIDYCSECKDPYDPEESRYLDQCEECGDGYVMEE